MARRKIGVDPEDLRDIIDMAHLASLHIQPKRCPGGRLIANGYVCGICGVDPSVVIERDGKRYRKCGAPKDKSLGRGMIDEDLTDALPMSG